MVVSLLLKRARYPLHLIFVGFVSNSGHCLGLILYFNLSLLPPLFMLVLSANKFVLSGEISKLARNLTQF